MTVVVNDASQIHLITKDLEKFAGKAVVSQVSKVVTALHYGTPVASGHARSNWLTTVGAPSENIVGTKQSVNSEAWRAGLARLSKWQFGQGDIYIANNVPYIGRLNSGWSSQAPAGFVEAALARTAVTSTALGG